VAKRAGVGIGTLYRHFPTREALFGYDPASSSLRPKRECPRRWRSQSKRTRNSEPIHTIV
jgi:hypothetical protein